MDFRYNVEAQSSGKTVKSILINEFKLSRKLIKKIKYHGRVSCNAIPVFMNHIVQTGDIIETSIDFNETSGNVKPAQMDLTILYEDDFLIILDKPPGLIIHPIGVNTENTIANGLKYYFEAKGYRIKIRPVSRLDRDTTGVIVFAKNAFIQDNLIKQMETHQYQKKYIGVVHGHPASSSGTINLPIARSAESIILREVSNSGAPSVTHYTVMEYMNNAALLSFILETGRTHQIRVHCQSMGHPLIGDTLYSKVPTALISRQALHSHSVTFAHPVTGQITEVTSPLPQDILGLLESIRTGYL